MAESVRIRLKFQSGGYSKDEIDEYRGYFEDLGDVQAETYEQPAAGAAFGLTILIFIGLAIAEGAIYDLAKKLGTKLLNVCVVGRREASIHLKHHRYSSTSPTSWSSWGTMIEVAIVQTSSRCIHGYWTAFPISWNRCDRTCPRPRSMRGSSSFFGFQYLPPKRKPITHPFSTTGNLAKKSTHVTPLARTTTRRRGLYST